jgi:tetratricopeptide (TPR) repeat protein
MPLSRLKVKGSKLKSIFCLAFCILCLVSSFAFIQRQLDRMKPSREQLKEKLIYIPSGRFIRTAALGFDAVIADLLWMRAVVYFGGHFLTDKDYRWLYHILDATTTLDPKNILAYRFGGTLLALEEQDVEASIAILKKGIQNNPDEDWKLYFLLGFNYSCILNDYIKAAEYLERASRIPGHPEYLPRLAARMYAKAEKIDTAIEFLQEMYRQHDDENVKAAIAGRIAILVAKKQALSEAKAISIAAEKYKEAHGQYPIEGGETPPLRLQTAAHPSPRTWGLGRGESSSYGATLDIEALIQAGLIRELPTYHNPRGMGDLSRGNGRYIIDLNTGKVDWVSESTAQWP